METTLAQYRLEDGTTFLVEVNEPPPASRGGVQRVALPGGEQQVYQTAYTLEKVLEPIQPVLSKVASRLKSGLTTPADEVEITFGLKLTAAAGVVFSSVGAEGTFEVKVKWGRDKA